MYQNFKSENSLTFAISVQNRVLILFFFFFFFSFILRGGLTQSKPEERQTKSRGSKRVLRVMSLTASFCAVLFPRDVLDELWDLIESVSEGFPFYSY